jgi:hypothetical protein
MSIIAPARISSLLRPVLLSSALIGLLPRDAWAKEGERVARTVLSWDLLIWFIPAFVFCIVVLARIDLWAQLLRKVIATRREARRKPGSSPLHPLPVLSFGEISRRSTKGCECGGTHKVVFEGGTTSKQRKLWLVIDACPECQVRRQTYFDVTGVREPPPLGSSPVTPASR